MGEWGSKVLNVFSENIQLFVLQTFREVIKKKNWDESVRLTDSVSLGASKGIFGGQFFFFGKISFTLVYENI